MSLLERESQLQVLSEALQRAAGGRGHTVLVTGEAGIGKTSLIEEFTRQAGVHARVLWGACEALFSPRPLGPLYDIAHTLGGALRTRLQTEANPLELFHGLLGEVRSHAQPTAIVLEDVHWADHATLDFVRFIARRIGQAPGLLVLSFRDDEVGADHPLTAVLGELPANARTRLRLPTLSRATVESMAKDAGRPSRDLYRTTGGNPFFVTEVLREGDDLLAPSVREAVLARARHLSDAGRAALDLISVAPDRVPLSTLGQALGQDMPGVEECIARGLLALDHEQVHFRHELARIAVEQALAPLKRLGLHRAFLQILTQSTIEPASLARVAHHAVCANDSEAILRFAPQAAAEATRLHSYREAHALLSATLPYVDQLPARERAAFLEQRMRTCVVMNQGKEARAMSEAAYRLWEELGDDFARGSNLIARFEIDRAHDPVSRLESLDHARRAVELLEKFPPSAQLAHGYACLAMQIGIDDADQARALRERALTLADQFENRARIPILGRCIAAEWMAHGAGTPRLISQLLGEAKSAGDDIESMRAYQQMAVMHFQARELDALERCVREAAEFAREHEFDHYLLAHSLERYGAEAHAAYGRWEQAVATFESVAQRKMLPWWLRLVLAQLQAQLIRARQGEALDEAVMTESLKRQSELSVNNVYVLHRTVAEIEWLRGRVEHGRAAAGVALDIAAKWGHEWVLGEATFWASLLTGGHIAQGSPPQMLASPYALLFSGEARSAAEHWKQRGYLYDQGLSLMLGDEVDQREAIRVLDSLGARAAAERVRERMRSSGVRGIPHAPLASTRSNNAGLTDREVEILALLARGLTNADIAERLHRSIRTVENHVAAVLDKLGANSRLNAVAIARSRGLIDD